MFIGTEMVLWFAAYACFLLTLMYFCVWGDPTTSSSVKFMSQTLPKKTWDYVGTMPNGKKVQSLLIYMSERYLMLIYFIVIYGCWSVVFFYCYPWAKEYMDLGYLSQWHYISGCLVFLSCIYTWTLANKTSPGIITKENIKQFENNYPFDNLLFVPNRICPTKKILKLPRSKFDRIKYQHHVPRFDHYCGWVDNTIGEQNYKYFLIFVATHVFMCLYGTYIGTICFYAEIDSQKLLDVKYFDRTTGIEYDANYFIIIQYLFHKRLYQSGIYVLVFFMSITLGAFLGYHIYITSIGRTTNEDFKWSQIKNWHKRQTQNYQNYINEQKKLPLDKQNKQNNKTIHIHTTDEDDITCAPPIVASSNDTSKNTVVVTSTSTHSSTAATTTDSSNKNVPNQKQRKQESHLREKGKRDENENFEDNDDNLFEENQIDPGPFPTNIYDRGFIENWKEVFYPLSLREEADKIVTPIQEKKSM